MYVAWDEAKNHANMLKHGIDFNDAVLMFQRPVLSLRDERLDYGEERWIRTLVGVVVHTGRRGQAMRIISARKATKREAKYYV
ncbi:BrnT family toxin [Pseudomonas protegens]|uniref:BrnT family toxin n=1 Tax=Pseudomonas protegens TaxID=380021 RepID=UPI00381DF652